MKRTLIGALAGALVMALVGATVGLAGGHRNATPVKLAALASPGDGGFLQTASTYLGLSVSTIRTDLQNGQTLAQIANATSGKSADGLIQALVAADTARITNLVNSTFPAKPVHPGEGVLGAGLQTAADYLGLSVATIQADLKSGQTLAQIANATSGKSADGLVQALVAAAKTKLDAAVAAGKLSSTQESTILATLQTRITSLVNGAFSGHKHPLGLGFGRHH